MPKNDAIIRAILPHLEPSTALMADLINPLAIPTLLKPFCLRSVTLAPNAVASPLNLAITGASSPAASGPKIGMLLNALEAGAPLSNLTFSSDGHGGVRRENPVTGEVTYTPAPLTLNYKEMVALVHDGILPLEQALRLITLNPAKNLSLRQKGRIAVGCDADFVALNEDLSIHHVYAKSKKVHDNE